MAGWTFTSEIKILIVQHISITYFIWFKTKLNLSADNFKKYPTSMGENVSPRHGQVILVSGYPVLTAVNWSQHWCAICVQYQFSCATKLASVRLNIGFHVVRTDGRKGGRCTVTWLPNFLGWVDFLSYGAPLARASGAWSSVKKPCYLHIALSNLNIVDSSESSLRIILLSTLVYPYEQDTMK